MATLAELTKALDALDPHALDEAGIVDWAQKQIAEAKGSPEHLAHVREQINAAQDAFAKGATGFRVKAYTPAAKQPTPLEAAGAKLAGLLGKSDGATEGTATESETEETEPEADNDAGDADEPAEKTKPKAKAKPTRKAAPEEVGKGFFEVGDNADEVFGSPLGASMANIKIGPDGTVYRR